MPIPSTEVNKSDVRDRELGAEVLIPMQSLTVSQTGSSKKVKLKSNNVASTAIKLKNTTKISVIIIVSITVP